MSGNLQLPRIVFADGRYRVVMVEMPGAPGGRVRLMAELQRKNATGALVWAPPDTETACVIFRAFALRQLRDSGPRNLEDVADALQACAALLVDQADGADAETLADIRGQLGTLRAAVRAVSQRRELPRGAPAEG